MSVISGGKRLRCPVTGTNHLISGRPPPSPPGPAVSIPVPCGPALMTQEMFGADRDNFENLKQKRKGSNSEHESDFPIQTDPDEPPRPCSHCEGLIIFISLKSTGKLRK
ncbi:uncharacterized protein LOC143770610 isoform X2 [Ranitomeya variabilis]|uniref:uncharacterized protein LOC143770610 isoform X2 n=1 Tax=Ranitomeya variabilis TaxID=490064 RepID=UPI004056F6CC